MCDYAHVYVYDRASTEADRRGVYVRTINIMDMYNSCLRYFWVRGGVTKGYLFTFSCVLTSGYRPSCSKE